MRYAMTGATGFIGGALAHELRRAGHDVVALVRDPAQAGALTDIGCELVAGDLADQSALEALCGGADGLFHVAGWYKLGTRHPEDGERINVEGTRNVLAAARRTGVARTVYTSTCAINSDTRGVAVDESYRFEGTHISAYDTTKAQAHAVAVAEAQSGLDIVIVQPGLVYGPGDTSQTGDLIAAVVTGDRPLAPAVGGKSWSYIDDIVSGHVRAMERGRSGESYIICGPEATLAEGLRIAADVAGTAGPRTLPGGAVRAVAAIVGVIEKVVPVPAGFAGETLRSAVASYLGDPAKAIAELGWSSRGIREGMIPTVAWLRAR